MADGGYRDDREALRAKVEELQQEITTLRQASAKQALPKGPAKKCVGCGNSQVVIERWGHDNSPRKYASALYNPRACAPGARVKLGWFRRCTEPGSHLHEHCRVCGLDWLTAFAEGT